MKCFDITERHAQTCVLPGVYQHTNTPRSTVMFSRHRIAGGGTHLSRLMPVREDHPALHELNFDALCGTSRVFDCTKLLPERLAGENIVAGERVFFRTPYSWQKVFVTIPQELVRFLIERKVASVGFDIPLSAIDHREAREMYEPLRARGITIIEGLNLRSVHPGTYFAITTPRGHRTKSGGQLVNVSLFETMVS